MKPALALCALLALAGAAPAQSDQASDYFRAFQRAMDGLRGGDCKPHLAKSAELAASPLLGTAISRPGQIAFLDALTDCAYEQDDFAIAFQAAQLWAERNADDAWVQAVRMDLGHLHERPDVTVEAFMTLVRIAPDYLRGLKVRDLWSVIEAAKKQGDGDEREFEVHQALLRIGYAPAPPEHDGYLRFDHAELLLARGDADTARARLGEITDVTLLARIRVERKFDALRGDPAFEARLDLAAAAERNVRASRDLVTAQPDSLQAVEDHVAALHVVGRPADALAAADAALAKHAADPEAFKDADDQLRWLLNRRGYLLYDLGRLEEARTAMRQAAGLAENGEPNVSNIINYTLMLVDEGAAREAAELLPKIGRASPYGQGWIEAARSCTGGQLQDQAMRKAGLDYLREHEADNRPAYSRALLCSNDLDASAAYFVQRLNDPEARGEALMALQDYTYPGDAHLPVLKVLRERLAAVRARPEVQAAVAAVGRIEVIPVHLFSGDI